jgi:hypothetical protein
MIVRTNGQPHQIYTRDPNAPYFTAIAAAACRLPSGHPEAFFEAFANVYRAAYDAICQRAAGKPFETRDTIYPNVFDGWEGMLFIDRCVASSAAGGTWQPLRLAAARL